MSLKKATVKQSNFIAMNIWKVVWEFQLLRCYQRKPVSWHLGVYCITALSYLWEHWQMPTRLWSIHIHSIVKLRKEFYCITSQHDRLHVCVRIHDGFCFMSSLSS